MVLPGRQLSRIASIDLFEKSINEAINSQSVTIRLEDDIDISRGV
jgi:sulfate adenylyltransferase subunit 1